MRHASNEVVETDRDRGTAMDQGDQGAWVNVLANEHDLSRKQRTTLLPLRQNERAVDENVKEGRRERVKGCLASLRCRH